MPHGFYVRMLWVKQGEGGSIDSSLSTSHVPTDIASNAMRGENTAMHNQREQKFSVYMEPSLDTGCSILSATAFGSVTRRNRWYRKLLCNPVVGEAPGHPRPS